ncbi:hypothetical protein [Sorangium sp. So ce341]|uniref:hypothetical protein n=1 Tax=Sorangium sp. So ce341 TaxID=3133302 RepID=UPI003F607076
MTGEDRFPFDDLLDEVKRSGVAIGPRERLAVARFLSRYDGTSREELRTAVASLLARSRAEVEIVEEAFDRVFPEEEPPTPPPTPPPPPPPMAPEARASARAALARWLRPRGRQLGALLATVALVTSAALWISPGSPDPPPGDTGSGGASGASTADSSASGASSASSASSTSGAGGGDVTACRPEEASIQRWYLPSLVLLLGTLLSLGVAGVVRGRRRLLARQRGTLTEAFVERPGPRWYDLAPTPDRSARAALDRLGVTLERSLREAVSSPEIDVARTVDATARAGLFPTLVRRTRLGRTRAVVLVDTSAASRPFRAVLEAFVEALERAGVDVTRLWFAGDPTRVAVRPGARAVPLGALAPRLGGQPLVLLGTGEAVAAASSDPLEALRVALQPWPASVLLTPIEDPDLWPRGLASPSAAVAAFPLDEHGVLGAARRLAALRSHAAAPAFAPRAERPPLDLVDLHLLRAMLALAPRPSFELAEALRRRFLPHAPGAILLAVAPIVEGRETEPERRALAGSLREARRSGRFPEAEVRRFLRDALVRAEPSDKDSAAYLRWEQELALQDLRAGDRRARRDARARLARLLAGPLGPELEGRLHKERSARRGVGEPHADLLRVIVDRGLRSLWPPRFALSGSAAASVLAAAALFAAVAAAAGAFSPRPLSIDGRANLVVDAEDLRMALCGFDRFYDVMVEAEATYGLARAPGSPLVVFKVSPVIGPIRAIQAVAQPVEAEDAFLERASATTLALVTKLPRVEGGERRELDPSSLTVSAGPASPRDFQVSDLLRCQSSLGVLPGTGDDVIERLLDPAKRHPRCPPPCGANEVWCPGVGCTNVTTEQSCGSCGNACRAGSSCVDRQCAPVCAPDRARCGDACVDVMADPRNCGGCAGGSGKDCGAGTCVGGVCVAPCPDGQPRCGDRCCPPRANATVRCDGEACDYSCNAGFQSCNGTLDDGCESNLWVDRDHCGDCATRCGRDERCSRGACRIVCPAGTTGCGDQCVDVMTDPRNCGGCAGGSGKDCGAGTCVGGVCVSPCPDGQPRCGDRCCPPRANATARCDGGVCDYSCYAGFQSCNGTMDDGCESNLWVDRDHCGDCATRCGRDESCSRGACIPPPSPPVSCEAACGDQFNQCRRYCEAAKSAQQAPDPDCAARCERDRARCLRSCEAMRQPPKVTPKK